MFSRALVLAPLFVYSRMPGPPRATASRAGGASSASAIHPSILLHRFFAAMPLWSRQGLLPRLCQQRCLTGKLHLLRDTARCPGPGPTGRCVFCVCV